MARSASRLQHVVDECEPIGAARLMEPEIGRGRCALIFRETYSASRLCSGCPLEREAAPRSILVQDGITQCQSPAELFRRGVCRLRKTLKCCVGPSSSLREGSGFMFVAACYSLGFVRAAVPVACGCAAFAFLGREFIVGKLGGCMQVR